MADTEISWVQWALTGAMTFGGGSMAWLLSKQNALEKDFIGHELYLERNFAKSETLTASVSQLNAKMDMVQKGLQDVALVQVSQAANISNMAENLKSIASDLKDKT